MSSSTLFHNYNVNQEISTSIHSISPIQQIMRYNQNFYFESNHENRLIVGWERGGCPFVRVTNPHKGPIDDKTPISSAARWPFVYGLQRGGSASKAMRGRLDWPV